MEEANLRQRKGLKLDKFLPAESQYASNKSHADFSLPSYAGYGIFFAVLIFLRFFYVYENVLPSQISIKQASSNPGKFIGQRAELQLKRLTDLGTRVVGSYENEVLTVDFLKREISFIAQGANKMHKIEIDIQKPTGSYYLYWKPFGFRNYYANIQNIVVKLSSTNSNQSVLLNCHYDTVPESPGASDNGLNCAVMLEILKVLSSDNIPLKNNIIFLFNGAEENPLQASHGFASQHKWSSEVKVIINLDAAGSGGKEVLFQTSGEAWLVKAYAKSVPRPYGAVQGEELFQYGIIPSDTDFRIFRDFGNYSGLDLAHCFNGYIYHTKYDRMEFIRPGVYQFTGDNMLALTKELVQSSELGKNHTKSNLIYFDVFQIFLFYYSETTAFLLNLTTVFLSLWSIGETLKSYLGFSRTGLKNFAYATGGSLFSLLLSGSVIFVIAKTLDFFKCTMSWYLKSWLIIPIYGIPIVLSMVAGLLLTQTTMKKDYSSHKAVYFILGSKLFWTLLLLIGTCFKIRSSFTVMLFILPMSVCSLILNFTRGKNSAENFFLYQMAALAFPLLYTLYNLVRVFVVIIPMTARMGPHTNPEMVVAALTFILSSMFLGYLVPLLLLQKKLKTFLIVLSGIHILTMFGVISTEYGFPYDGDPHNPALQRFYVLHCERTFHDVKGTVRRSDSGFFVLSLDRNNLKYVSRVVSQLKSAQPVSEDCDKELYCGFPVFTSRFIRPAEYGASIKALPPTIHHPTSLEVINQTQILVNVRRIRLLVTGPDHITIVLSLKEGVRLVRWSFDELEPMESQTWNGRPTYLIYYSHGLMGGTLEFDFDLEINKPHSDSGVLDVAVVGHYMHDKNIRTKEFKDFLTRFPDWAHTTAWTTTYKSWVI